MSTHQSHPQHFCQKLQANGSSQKRVKAAVRLAQHKIWYASMIQSEPSELTIKNVNGADVNALFNKYWKNYVAQTDYSTAFFHQEEWSTHIHFGECGGTCGTTVIKKPDYTDTMGNKDGLPYFEYESDGDTCTSYLYVYLHPDMVTTDGFTNGRVAVAGQCSAQLEEEEYAAHRLCYCWDQKYAQISLPPTIGLGPM